MDDRRNAARAAYTASARKSSVVGREKMHHLATSFLVQFGYIRALERKQGNVTEEHNLPDETNNDHLAAAAHPFSLPLIFFFFFGLTHDRTHQSNLGGFDFGLSTPNRRSRKRESMY